MTSGFENTEFGNLISNISIEELNKVGDKEIVNLVSELKNDIPEFECDPELEMISNNEENIVNLLSEFECDPELEIISDNEEPLNKRKFLKNFTIKHLTKAVSDGEKCKALKKIITKIFDKFSNETINKLFYHYIALKWFKWFFFFWYSPYT